MENDKITIGILNGTITDARRDVVLMNAGCAIYISGKADTIADGIEMARESIDSGKALEKLNELIEFTNKE